MKTLCAVFFAILIISSYNLYAQSNDDDKNVGIPIEASPTSINHLQLDTLVYEVYGMDCPGCHSALEKQINKLSVVSNSEANWVKQEVRIVVKKDSMINEEELFKKIKKANFTPGERKID